MLDASASAHSPSTLTIILAVWGAILSSVTFGWNLLRDLRDKANIKVTARVCRIITRVDGAVLMVNPDMVGEGRLFVVLSAVNVGRRTVRWAGAGGHYKTPVNGKDSFVVNARHLPRTLAEAEAHDEVIEFDDSFVNDNIERLYIWDTFGREWDLSRKDFKKLVSDAKKYAAKLQVQGKAELG